MITGLQVYGSDALAENTRALVETSRELTAGYMDLERARIEALRQGQEEIMESEARGRAELNDWFFSRLDKIDKDLRALLVSLG
mgnify:CR=1 FL=1